MFSNQHVLCALKKVTGLKQPKREHFLSKMKPNSTLLFLNVALLQSVQTGSGKRLIKPILEREFTFIKTSLVLNRLNKPDLRYQRRMARIERWDRPITTQSERFKAWIHMLLSDHGLFRLFYLNRHRVTEQFWRAAQPAPHQLAQLRKEGIRTIVNLRGGREHGSWQLQKEACDSLGLTLVDYVVRSREAPERETILQLKAFFDQLDYPVLVHCKSGADRAGFMSALYLILKEGRPVKEAIKQLSFTYGHFQFAKTGILDAFLETYAREGEAKGLSLPVWVATLYDPERLQKEFKTGLFSSLIADQLIRRE
jgi:uncharacterized protein (TIGR01244 family)